MVIGGIDTGMVTMMADGNVIMGMTDMMIAGNATTGTIGMMAEDAEENLRVEEGQSGNPMANSANEALKAKKFVLHPLKIKLALAQLRILRDQILEDLVEKCLRQVQTARCVLADLRVPNKDSVETKKRFFSLPR
jgi:hypothetical protein